MYKIHSAQWTGDNNPTKGSGIMGIWIKKYGQEIASKKLKNLKNKLSISKLGKKNPMYGKISPEGSGRGISGWYKGWYFRSLLELSYRIKVLERFDIPWRSAELADLRSNYFDKTYVADFFIAEKYLVECKPKNLKNTPTNILKAEAAKKLCSKFGYIYKITTPVRFTISELYDLYMNKSIKIIDSKI